MVHKCDVNQKDCKHKYKYDQEDRSMESERYICIYCGHSYKLYYEDMQ